MISKIKKIFIDINKIKKEREIVVLILSSNNNFKKPHISPIRKNERIITFSILIDKIEDLDNIIDFIYKNTDYIFVDTQRKIKADVYDKFINSKYKDKIFPINPNDITVQATYEIVDKLFKYNLRDKKILIIGLGNIGAKLIIKLYERLNHMYICSHKDNSKLIDYLTQIQPKFNNCIVTNSDINSVDLKIFDAIIMCTPQLNIIDINKIKKLNTSCILIDVGLGNITEGAVSYAIKNNVKAFRVDTEEALLCSIILTLGIGLFVSKINRKTINGKHYISGGTLGKKGDIIVNDINNIEIIYGKVK